VRRRDERLPWLVLAAVLVAAASVRDVDGLPAWAPAALGATALLRASLDALGLRVRKLSLTPAAWVFGPALVLAWVLHAARAGTPPSAAVLGVVVAATAYSTLTSAGFAATSVGFAGTSAGFAGRSAGTAGALRTTALAGVTALCAAFAVPTPTTTLCLVAFVVLAVPIAATAADRFGSAAGSSGDPTVRRVRAAPILAERPARAGVGALALLALGLPFGAALFAAFPPPPGRSRTADASARGAEASRGAAAGGVEGEDRAGEDVARTGSRTGGRSAFVASLRADPRVVLRVRVGEGERGREPLVLRGETYDLFDGRSWTRSGAADAGTEIVPPRPGGWGFVTSGASSDRVVRVSFLDVTGAPPAALPLVPEARRVRLLEGLETHRMRRRGDGAVALLAPRRPDARWEQEADVALVSREVLPSLRCDRDVAPLTSYAQPPPEAAALAALASTVVGDAPTAAVEAERLEAWLRGPDFRYALEVEADPRRPVADFVLRARSGHCWCFASTMTAMMRSLGRPARLALGYRGGDFLETLGEWAVRGTNAHAWCEVFYEGAGWVPYDPTPPS